MKTLSIKWFGFGMGAGCALAYIFCALIMLTVSRDAAVWFFNSISHGINWAPIMRWNMPLWETAMGTLEVFVLGWLFGAAVALFYNLGARRRR